MKIYRLTVAIVISFFVFIIRIIYLANTGQPSLFFDLTKSIPFGDKTGHFFIFGFLTLGANLIFKHINIRQFKLYTGTVLVSFFAVAEELSQVFYDSRTLDSNDLIADGLGIFSFTLMFHFLSKKGLIDALKNQI